jgi:hypothetical protein
MDYRYPHGLGRLPAEFEPAVEAARAEAEATFRETLANNKPRQWHQLQAAIMAAMTSSFDVFRRQACLAVQQGHLGVSAAQAGAEEFLETQARAIHGWLVPIIERDIRYLPVPLSATRLYRFRRYESNDEFVFSRDMVELVKSSNVWAQLLRVLANRDTSIHRSQSQARDNGQSKRMKARCGFVDPKLERMGKSSYQWALDAEVTYKTVQSYLSGFTGTLRRDTRTKLAAALKVPVKMLPEWTRLASLDSL